MRCYYPPRNRKQGGKTRKSNTVNLNNTTIQVGFKPNGITAQKKKGTNEKIFLLREEKGMKLRKCMSALLVTTMVATSFAGCGGGDKEDTGKKNESSDVIVVDFWTAPQQVQYNLWESRAQAFNETKTQLDGKTIQVKVQQMPESPSSEAGIQNAIATGTAPEVSENVNRGFAATLAASDVVYDLSGEEWFQEVLDARVIGDDTMDKWAIDGKQYVLPLYVNPMVWQWNMKG